MRIWISLILVFLLQEVVSTTITLSLAREQHLSLLLISTLWLTTVLFETIIIYLLGDWIEKRVSHTKFGVWLNRYRIWFEKVVGRFGEEIAIMILAFIFSPGLAALLAALLEIPFTTSVFLVVLADLFWYLFEWAVVIGIAHVSSSFEETICIILGVGLVLTIGINLAQQQLRKAN